MAVMAAAALGFALKTQSSRRAYDHVAPPEAQQARGSAFAYLPADVNILAAVRVADVIDQPAGKDLLGLLGLGQGQDGMDRFGKLTGMKPADLEVVVLGVKAREGQVRPTLIWQARRPYDAARVREALGAREAVTRRGKQLYPFKTDKAPLGGVVWQPAENILVMGLSIEDLDAVASTAARTDVPKAINSVLGGAGKDAAVRMVGSLGPGDNAAVLPFLLAFPEAERQALARLRGLDVAVQVASLVRLTATLDFADEKAAAVLEEYVGRARAEKPQLAEVWRGLTTVREKERLTVMISCTPELLRRALRDVGYGGGRRKERDDRRRQP
jgi:hypothetical protein